MEDLLIVANVVILFLEMFVITLFDHYLIVTLRKMYYPSGFVGCSIVHQPLFTKCLLPGGISASVFYEV